MGRRNKKENIVLENIELKPQVIGYTYKKKSNIGRVIFIFIAFALVVYYINDISIFINNLLGKNSAESIENLAGSSNKVDENKNENIEKEAVEFYVYDNNLNFVNDNMLFNNFNFDNDKLYFDILNESEKKLELKNKKYFMEFYSDNKTLLERVKIDINTINEKSKISYSIDVNNTFYYLVFVEKSIDDYPIVSLEKDENGLSKIKCIKNIEEIEYNFRNDKLESISHRISDSNISDVNYYSNYTAYQRLVASYNSFDGIIASFNGTLNGYTAIINIDLQKADLNILEDKYYYAVDEQPKVVNFEMQTYGFNCE